jgi:hypothetical protein
MKILALEQDIDGVSTDKFQPYLQAEASHVWKLVQTGILREIYYRQDRSSAVLILECATVAEAVQVLNTLPLVKNSLVRFEVIPLKPYPGFSRLFKEP